MQINKSKAESILKDYLKEFYGKIKILSVDERKNMFLFEFSRENDILPIDYPIISINKSNGKVKELLFTNSDDAKIIFNEE